MTDEKKDSANTTTQEGSKKSDPIDDVREGLGLLFRAAKSTIERLPTKDLEKGVTEGVQEVGKAIGRVVDALSKEILPKDAASTTSPAGSASTDASVSKEAASPEAEAKKPEENAAQKPDAP